MEINRQQQLLAEAREDRNSFLLPEDQGSTKSSDSDGSDLPPPGFTFPVTKQIINFLGTFSTAQPENEQKDERRPVGKPLSYKALMERLKDPGASDILSAIRSFVIRFNADCFADGREEEHHGRESIWSEATMPGENNEMAQVFQTFLVKLENQVRQNKLWRGCNEEEWASTVEGLEKFVVCKIEKAAFQPTSYDKELDNQLHLDIARASFLNIEHLYPNIGKTGQAHESEWMAAGNELNRINEFRAPRDKLVCILNCCRLITNILSSQEDQPGADEFLPAFIYVILKSNPVNLHSNIEYIAAYRCSKRLVSEPAYFFTHLTCAVAFIQRLDASILAIEPSHFLAGIEYCENKIAADPGWTCGWDNIPFDLVDSSALILPRRCHSEAQSEDSLASITNTSLKPLISPYVLPPVHDAIQLAQWKVQRFKFMDKSVHDLKVSELIEMMEEYKTLVSTVDHLLQS